MSETQPRAAVYESHLTKDGITSAAKRQATVLTSQSSRSQQYQRTLSAREERRLEQNRIRARETRKRDKAKWQQMQQAIVSLTRENEQLKRRNEMLSSELTFALSGMAPQQAVHSVPQVVGPHSLGLSGGAMPSFAVRQQPAMSVAAVQRPSLTVASAQRPTLGLSAINSQQSGLVLRQIDYAQISPGAISASRADLVHVAGVPPASAGIALPGSAVGPHDLEIVRQQQYGHLHSTSGIPGSCSGLSGSDVRRSLG
eukprot:CAMPEP_0183308652 /NCGR_PEP_ID=MMETSP0160_2-20130417/22380_1 /TAXON_ID=2839 ORGANISM="Odontella Sinensis, Strain Grunow 1884" /NCGR_SAMPLE_ID=MMETSP0160_2 /ASSEMBLY_ACC=CAM_ASM_000250 /LENGTH=255 /DNA_ID=CAMNT_0025472521 /DNA_START=65 /DNA_END=832 /DNA_ORIENTATION=+